MLDEDEYEQENNDEYNYYDEHDMKLYDEYYDDSEDRELSYDDYSVLDENEYEQENNDEYNYYDEHDMKLYDEYYDHSEDREISDRGKFMHFMPFKLTENLKVLAHVLIKSLLHKKL